MTTTSTVPTPDEIWKILREVSTSQKETAAFQKEDSQKASREMEEIRAFQKEDSRKTSRAIKEFRASQEEGSRKASREIEEIRALHREIAEEQKEIAASQKKTDQQLKKTEALFNSQWGRLMESLVEGDLLAILQQKGINVLQTYKNVEQRGSEDDFEYDIIAANGEEVVVVEVKTTLRVKDVKDFLISLRKFTTRMPIFNQKTIYGAVAWLKADEESQVYAEKQGLFVIRATGSSASIVNQENFKPQVFS